MKKNTIALRERQLENLKGDLRHAKRNNVAPEEMERIEESIEELGALVDAMKQDEADHTAEDAFKAMIDKLQERLDALEEKMRTDDQDDTQEAQNKLLKKGYLASKNAIHDFAEAFRAVKAGRGSFNALWGEALRKNSITYTSGSEGAFLPEAVRGKIEDLWQKNFNWLNRLNNTGAKAFVVRTNTSEQDAETSRAKGHTAGNKKVEQVLNFAAKTINAQFIYKLQKMDKLTDWSDDGALVAYITNELFTQWMYEVQRAILIGDGRESNSTNKIRSIEAVNRTTTDAFVTVAAEDGENSLKSEIMSKLLVNVNTNDGDEIILFVTKADYLKLREKVVATGATPEFISKDDLKDELGVTDVITCDYLTGAGVRAIAMRPDKYYTVGAIEPRFDMWEIYDENVIGYRVESPFGGAVAGLKSAAVLTISE